jgi:hypothetical protein
MFQNEMLSRSSGRDRLTQTSLTKCRHNSIEGKQVIKETMLNFHNDTCIRFIPSKSADKDYIDINKGSGCVSQGVGVLYKEGNRWYLLETVVHTLA